MHLAPLSVHSGRPANPKGSIHPRFVLPRSLDAPTANTLSGFLSSWHGNTPLWYVTEALAQLATLHTRWLCDFACHGFLLSIRSLPTTPSIHPAVSAKNEKEKAYHIHAELLAQSGAGHTKTFEYKVSLELPTHPVQGVLRTATRPYDQTFSATLLQTRYQRLFTWLQQH